MLFVRGDLIEFEGYIMRIEETWRDEDGELVTFVAEALGKDDGKPWYNVKGFRDEDLVRVVIH